MHDVGRHLHLQAKKMVLQGQDADDFARSAYSRYYYGMYLQVRQMLAEMDPKWAPQPHASIPDLLSGTIRKKFGRLIARSIKAEDSQSVSELRKVQSLIMTTASEMRRGYDIRVMADYRNEEDHSRDTDNVLVLLSTPLDKASAWADATDVRVSAILNAWRKYE